MHRVCYCWLNWSSNCGSVPPPLVIHVCNYIPLRADVPAGFSLATAVSATHMHTMLIRSLSIITVVKEEDICFLMDILCKYSSEWRNIGTALNFMHSDLKMIDFNPQATTLQWRLLEVLTQWSHRIHPHVPTVEELCAALRSNLVGLGVVANEIEARKGSLPSQQS